NCLSPAETWDATVAAQKAMSCVYRSGQRFGVAHLVDILRGIENERIVQFGHDRLSTFGVGADLDARTWRGVFRQLVAAGLLDVDTEGYGGLRLTDASRAVLRGERTVMLRKELPRRKQRERSRATGSTAPAIELSPAEQPLFEALRDLRTRLAREQNVPPYVIFHDATLRGITRQRPASLDELAQVGGIGGTKLERYGEQVLEVVAMAPADAAEAGA